MEIRRLVASDLATWWHIARHCPWASFFQTPLWTRLAILTYPVFHDVTVLAKIGGMTFVVPLLETWRSRHLGYRTVISTFGGCYGGPIAVDRVPSSLLSDLYERLREWDLALLRITASPRIDGFPQPSRFQVESDVTQIVHLHDGFEAVYARFSEGHRRSVRKAKRLGVTIRLARDLDDYREYYRVYQDSMDRWGPRATARYPFRLFEAGYHLAEEHPELIRLWLAEYQGRIVVGAWTFCWNDQVNYWHGASREEAFPCSAGFLLQAEIIRDACERGFQIYDLNPSAGLTGVLRFKDGFGAETLVVRRHNYSGELVRRVQGFRVWAERASRKLFQ